MSIQKHHLWKKLKKFLVIEIYSRDGIVKPRFRIVFRPMPPELLAEALNMEIPCAACGETIRPVRNKGGWRVYYAGSCELEKKIKCSRSRSVSREYQAIKKEMDEDAQAEPSAGQLDLWL